MTKPVRIKSTAIVQESWSKFSKWGPVCQFEQCCDCGSVHETQFRVVEKRGMDEIQIRVRAARGRTKLARQRNERLELIGRLCAYE